jgi:acetyltransferase-like isoleucine patch superfamily enzyme
MNREPDRTGSMSAAELKALLARVTDMPMNPFHPFVWLIGEPEIGDNVQIGAFSEVNARKASVKIGAHCDIASFVSINCADSHEVCIGLADEIAREDIVLEDHVFVGSHSFIKGGAHIGHHSVIAAGSIVGRGVVPPYSLVAGNPATVKPGYYRARVEARRGNKPGR